MIRVIRSIRLRQGKRSEAVAWISEANEYLKSNSPELLDSVSFALVAGPVNVLMTHQDFEDLATYESWSQRFLPGGGLREWWQGMSARQDEFAIEGSRETKLCRSF